MIGTAANTSDAERNQHYIPLYYAALKWPTSLDLNKCAPQEVAMKYIQ